MPGCACPAAEHRRIGHPIDLSAVAIDYLGHHRQATRDGELAGGTPIELACDAGTGTVRDPDLVALDELISRINYLFAGENPIIPSATWSPTSRTGSRRTATYTQAQDNSLAQFSASPDIDVAFTDAVIGAMNSSAYLSAKTLNNQDLARALLGELLPAINRTLSMAS